MTAVQIEAIFAERERKNYEELVAPIIAPKSACADCGQIETECHLELVGGKVMCCDCIDPKPTEEEEEEEEEESVCDDEQRSYGGRGAPAPESDDEEEVCECCCCDAPLDEDEHIFIFTRGNEEKTVCQMCGEDLHEGWKACGWKRDDEEDEEDEEDCECPDCGNTFSPETSISFSCCDNCWNGDDEEDEEEKTEKPKPTCERDGED
jgi:hypothetical protein